MKLTYQNPQTVYERAVTSCESKIIDLERRQHIKDSEKRARTIEVQRYILDVLHEYSERDPANLLVTETPEEQEQTLKEYEKTRQKYRELLGDRY